MNEAIMNAIKQRHVLTLVYHGHPRRVEPHCYGVTTAGNEALRGYQTQGGSRTGEVPGWKMMLLREVHQLADTGEKFATPRPAYQRDEKGMKTIHAQL